jgi:hypothetical protein
MIAKRTDGGMWIEWGLGDSKNSFKMAIHAEKINRTSTEETEGNPKTATGLRAYNLSR